MFLDLLLALIFHINVFLFNFFKLGWSCKMVTWHTVLLRVLELDLIYVSSDKAWVMCFHWKFPPAVDKSSRNQTFVVSWYIFLGLFMQSVVNIKPQVAEESEEDKEKKHKTFVEKYEKQIKHFGEERPRARRWLRTSCCEVCSISPPPPRVLSSPQACCGAGMTARSICLTTLI